VDEVGKRARWSEREEGHANSEAAPTGRANRVEREGGGGGKAGMGWLGRLRRKAEGERGRRPL
jgi:hypothetical protein